MSTPEEIAREIAVCTCANRPEHYVTNDKHFANCPTELVEDIAAALIKYGNERVEACAAHVEHVFDRNDDSKAGEELDDAWNDAQSRGDPAGVLGYAEAQAKVLAKQLCTLIEKDGT